MLYSKTCEYAIRALAHLSTKPKNVLTMIPEIGEVTKVPVSYLAKIFQSLVKNNILTSRRGPAGGFSLKTDPGKLTLLEIVSAVDHIDALEECAMGLEDCSNYKSCPLHEVWKETKQKILSQLQGCSLSQFIAQTKGRIYRPCRRSRLSLSF